jgi:hypothetical protein
MVDFLCGRHEMKTNGCAKIDKIFLQDRYRIDIG